MSLSELSAQLLANESKALLRRLDMINPFVLQTPMVPAASAPRALWAIEEYLTRGRRSLRKMVERFISWLDARSGQEFSPAQAQRRFTILRLRFNTVLTQFDIFADALGQRSEHENGVWLAGLDVFAADALRIPGGFYEPPALLCYLDRGAGAAIRRARTRLPGGGENPVAIIRVPRERMVGSGIASSLVHEVGHQAAALLGLVKSMRPLLQSLQKGGGAERLAWSLFERWISEILADFWSVARIGIGSTMGLMGVVSLPKAFVFRLSLDDPHPMPWLRVKLSCAMGRALYPHPQWDNLGRIWEAYYPPQGIRDDVKRVLDLVQQTTPAFVDLLTQHRPKTLKGYSLVEVLSVSKRTPARLQDVWRRWETSPAERLTTAPTLAFGVINQAKADGVLQPEREGVLIAGLLRSWALDRAVDTSQICMNGHAGRAPGRVSSVGLVSY